jgi:hypothetical protein
MKLLFCNDCLSVFSLSPNIIKKCDCGNSEGKYSDNLNAVYKGNCIPLGFHNTEFINALKTQPKSGWGSDFKAFVIAKECETFKKI